jgi:hypothetical protein
LLGIRGGHLTIWMPRHSFGAELFAGANRAGESAVVDAVGDVPQGLSQFNAAAEDFDLVGASGWRIGWHEVIVLVWDEVFVVTVPQDCFENVLAMAHKLKFPVFTLLN